MSDPIKIKAEVDSAEEMKRYFDTSIGTVNMGIDVDLTIGRKPGKEVCDFCNGPNPILSYPCKEFSSAIFITDTASHELKSDDEWYACEECRRLIDIGYYKALIHRAISSINEDMDDTSRLLLYNQINAFRDNRSGPPTPLKDR